MRCEADPPLTLSGDLVVRVLDADRLLWRVRERRGVLVVNIEIHFVRPTEAVHIFHAGLTVRRVQEHAPELILSESIVRPPTRRGITVAELENAVALHEVKLSLSCCLQPFVPAALGARLRGDLCAHFCLCSHRAKRRKRVSLPETCWWPLEQSDDSDDDNYRWPTPRVEEVEAYTPLVFLRIQTAGGLRPNRPTENVQAYAPSNAGRRGMPREAYAPPVLSFSPHSPEAY